jgi:hypothetical protein
MEKSHWDAVYRHMIDEGRAQNAPPTAEEVEALFRGDLPEQEAERVRDLLVYYPEMARVMTQAPPPEEGNVLTEEERAADWAALRKRIRPPVELRPRPSRAYVFATAAALALLLGGAILYFRSRPAKPPGSVGPPQIAKHVVHGKLRPDAETRGPNAVPSNILEPADEYVLTLLTDDIAHYAGYRFDMIDLDTDNTIWTRSGLHEPPNDAFEITVSNQILKAGGHYRLVLYGAPPARLVRLATYTVRVSRS